MKTIYCPTKGLRPVIVDIAQAMRTVNQGDFLQIISDQAFMVREARAFAHMHGCEVVHVADREVKTLTFSSDPGGQFRWDDSRPATNHEWLIWLKK
ncbi:MAG: hypothetical protein M1294_02875 [Firmicutes bacterium]|uniref:Uncharacterized protein n=1 Tax=Sulfobacillus benefaciens TaxID=453960 RepID=A0A2T2XBL5_9FIRM|nr:hypothetical protein [Bacillota bacterium]MCL5012456.1 hypothetical protein [Bacillota bacterium]PSR31836.1 MAG: hypothetical protein C7B43_01040 [Sulfobacillus benefaciens]